MPVLEYYGNLWGFEAEDKEGGRKILCSNCYDKLTRDGKIGKAISALGTEDHDEDEPDRKSVYVCDESGHFSK